MFLVCPVSLKPTFVPLQLLNFLQGWLHQIEIDDKAHFEVIKGICFSFNFSYHRMKRMKNDIFFSSNYMSDFSNFMRAENSLWTLCVLALSSQASCFTPPQHYHHLLFETWVFRLSILVNTSKSVKAGVKLKYFLVYVFLCHLSLGKWIPLVLNLLEYQDSVGDLIQDFLHLLIIFHLYPRGWPMTSAPIHQASHGVLPLSTLCGDILAWHRRSSLWE